MSSCPKVHSTLTHGPGAKCPWCDEPLDIEDESENDVTIDGDYFNLSDIRLNSTPSYEVTVMDEKGNKLSSWPSMSAMVKDLRNLGAIKGKLDVVKQYLDDILSLDYPRSSWRQTVTLQQIIEYVREVYPVIDAPICDGPPPHLDIPDPDCPSCGHAA